MVRNREAKDIREVAASGSHYQVGVSLGKQCRDQAVRIHKRFKADVGRRPDMTMAKAVSAAKKTLPLSREFFPEYVEELEGYADGAGLSFDEFYAGVGDLPGTGKGCTDIAVNAQWTKDDSVFAAHNEDVEPYNFEDLAIVRVKPSGEPGFIGVSYGGILPTIGLNAAGISLTGNALVQNDSRLGIPKMFAARKVLSARGLYDALRFAVPAGRGSSFNNIVCDHNGEIYSMEGSATTFDAVYADDGYLIHSNHYLSPRMWKFETDLHTRISSIIRYNRAKNLFKKHLGQVEVSTFKEIFSDHVGYPESICRHADPSLCEAEQTSTVFSTVLDLTHNVAWICPGNPCTGEYRRYEL
ncbi:MAG: C45 family peptidase [Thermoplasmata archaeon]|nr:C45 family peptidase [Thermoplasmata archaeon]